MSALSARAAFDREYRALRMAYWGEATPNTPAGRALAARRSEPFLPAYVGKFARYTPNRYMRLLWARMDTCHG